MSLLILSSLAVRNDLSTPRQHVYLLGRLAVAVDWDEDPGFADRVHDLLAERGQTADDFDALSYEEALAWTDGLHE